MIEKVIKNYAENAVKVYRLSICEASLNLLSKENEENNNKEDFTVSQNLEISDRENKNSTQKKLFFFKVSSLLIFLRLLIFY